MARHEPWLRIPANDYEGHMGHDGADQLAPLSILFEEIYESVRPARVALLGCATGNGLEHVDPAITSRVVGVDVNIQYLAVARQRHMALGARLELYCADIERCRFEAGAFDLVHAALLFEYVDPAALVERMASWAAAAGTCSVVLQLPDGGAPVTPTRYASLAGLGEAMRLVPPEELARLFERQGFGTKASRAVAVKGGRRLFAATFTR